jgi:hypothetical protein
MAGKRTKMPGKLVRRYVRLPARSLTPEQLDKQVKYREDTAKALQLRQDGATYREIATFMGWKSPATAQSRVKKALEEIILEPAKEVIMTDMLRLDEFQKRLTNAMRQGDLGVIPTLMNVMRERRSLLGWTEETWAEEQRKGQGVTNNGVMVINGGQASFIEGMMQAIGIDPNSPEAKKHLDRVRLEEEKAGSGEFAVPAPRVNDVMMQRAGEIENIVEAEIVEESID